MEGPMQHLTYVIVERLWLVSWIKTSLSALSIERLQMADEQELISQQIQIVSCPHSSTSWTIRGDLLKRSCLGHCVLDRSVLYLLLIESRQTHYA